ncbi:MAG TPA: c-type cytochrome [Kofleriaceae bacterium]|nr:c-type cytochrome [Kofleriaceae bacterium]
MRSFLLATAFASLVVAYSLTAFTAPTTVDAQIAQGKKLYGEKCAKCHGNAGQGSKDGPPVVGKDAFPLDPRKGQKRAGQFHTAADVFAFASKKMPPKTPGSLTTDQYLAIFAFDLTANGIKLDKPLDAEAAAKIVLHP